MTPAIERRLNELFDGDDAFRGIEAGQGYAVGSVQGPVRPENQDRAFVAHIVQGGEKPRELFVGAVFDGMGGMREGGVAAAMAASRFLSVVAQTEGPVAFRLEAAIQSANASVYDEFGGRGGTTLTAVAFADPRVAHAVHVGDSRLYRSSQSENLTLVSEDQTLAGLAQSEGSHVDEDELDNRLLQYVGIGPELEPSFYKVTDSDRSTWVLTTDGAHSFGRKNLLGILRSAPSCSTAVRRLIAGADAFGTDDNATIVAIKPSEFVSKPFLFEGTSIVVWTAFRTVELWIEDRHEGPKSASPIAPQEAPAPPTRASISARPLRLKSPKTAKKAAKSPSNKATRKADQLKITFGDDGGEAT